MADGDKPKGATPPGLPATEPRGYFEGESTTRRNAFAVAGQALGGVAGAAIILPAVGFALAPIFKKPQETWQAVGPTSDFAEDTYRPVTTPGVWIPTTPPLFAEYARAKPWVIGRADAMPPGPPPDLKSDLYARDYNETKDLGGAKSTKRTPEQTDAVKFWTQANLSTGWQEVTRQISVRNALVQNVSASQAASHGLTSMPNRATPKKNRNSCINSGVPWKNSTYHLVSRSSQPICCVPPRTLRRCGTSRRSTRSCGRYRTSWSA